MKLPVSPSENQYNVIQRAKHQETNILSKHENCFQASSTDWNQKIVFRFQSRPFFSYLLLLLIKNKKAGVHDIQVQKRNKTSSSTSDSTRTILTYRVHKRTANLSAMPSYCLHQALPLKSTSVSRSLLLYSHIY